MRRWLALAIVVVGCAGARTQPAGPAKAPSAAVKATRAPKVVRLAASVERSQLEKDVAWIAKMRPPKSAHHLHVRRVLGERLEKLGLAREDQDYGTGVNVIGRHAGRDPEQVIVSAHYDHIPGCPGADDNGSGIAVALEAARVLGRAPRHRTLVVAFWDEEEDGLYGSRAFANRARDRGDKIRLAISLDTVGFASSEPASQRVPEGLEAALPEQSADLRKRGYVGDFVALVANTAASESMGVFEAHARATKLRVMSLALPPLAGLLFPDVFRSDHASFWQNGYPSFVLTDTAEYRNPAYHCLNGRDTPSTLDYDFLARVAEATARTLSELLGE